MQLLITDRFEYELSRILVFIAKNNPQNAIDFKNSLMIKLQNTISMPYACRISAKFNQENIREFIFKGYTIIYKITENIELLGIYRDNIWGS
ncbi:hypothetical protein BKH41_05750 [Helicobacter sp. 12S02232-10]|uniref:type II toxin-antitoxin system RelE/ParE family toxin n=1 Tax=Helicobacter sp. 12S02232-10 TaxID=1476197 RepID=UPI000BA75C24|nr:type II toxin-antitoxin system RelE/ParE family toxin [Helicobacter sp. 12S02232-10]PAF48765.1 hypothetical protein BKH41_05750 [Helicobacter sp. 12S02232-10]